MEEFINFLGDFLLGFLTCLVFSKGIIKITVHHINENIVPKVTEVDLNELEKQMLDKKQDERDDAYNTEAIIKDVSDIMGGSDRA
jgi:hypothetical protein